MSKETTKSFNCRNIKGHFEKYLKGNGIDIGAGDDPLQIVNGTTRPFDMRDGDAQYMNGIEDNVFDFVYSSHCLEHMIDINIAINNWTRILKPTGFLYITVPDFDLYEKGIFPSRFNGDHKHTFSTIKTKESVGRNNHYLLPNDLTYTNLKLLECSIESDGYNPSLSIDVDQTQGIALCQINIIFQKSE